MHSISIAIKNPEIKKATQISCHVFALHSESTEVLLYSAKAHFHSAKVSAYWFFGYPISLFYKICYLTFDIVVNKTPPFGNLPNKVIVKVFIQLSTFLTSLPTQMQTEYWLRAFWRSSPCKDWLYVFAASTWWRAILLLAEITDLFFNCRFF